ncbi:OmpA family protein [Siansivirga zeaxanthinifaciens]|nr:OmpA family protein [Siansivirga zeaxanthinifaciens]
MNKKIVLGLFLLFIGAISYAQTKDNPWAIEVGVNAVDVYPVGENSPQGEYFDEFFNWTDHWNIGIPTVKVSKYLGSNFSISARGSYNKLSKWGETATQSSAFVNKLEYYGLDGMINYSFANLEKSPKLEPFIGIGGGYTWIKEGTYNSNGTGGNNFVGAGTLNGSLGLKFWAAKNVGFSLETTYKHSFEEFLTKHWQHSFGVVFKLGKVNEEVAEVSNDDDGDGVPNEFDLCPTVSGPKEFGGCPDSDNDGIPDNLDKCPNVKGDNNGCPAPVKEEVVVKTETKPVVPTNKTIYFDLDSAEVSNNAKVVLDDIVSSLKETSKYNITVEGYADNTGSDSYNKKLSLKRASNVAEYLVSKGLSSSAIEQAGFGEEKPVAPNNTAEGKALNRRAELNIKINF